jgi:hypothetical protein
MVGQQWPKQSKSPSDGYYQDQISYTDGLQTPALLQPSSTFLTPLKFWFNKGLDQAFLSAAIPFGQRFINISISSPQVLADKVARFKRITTLRAHKYVGAVLPSVHLFPAVMVAGDYLITE